MNNTINRRQFIKQLGITGIGLVISNSIFANLLENKEAIKKPNIISRPDRDDLRSQLRVQYNKKLGEWFTIDLQGKKYNRMVNVLPYLDNNFQRENLQDVYKRIIIHHSAIDPTGNTIEQAKELRDREITKMGYSDIAYHFLISSDGKIIEARPCFRIGAHAGTSKEFNIKAGSILPGGIQSLASMSGPKYKEALIEYLNAMRLDPDYGSIGICLCGNFENTIPTKEQLFSLQSLLNRIKYTYKIPSENIIFHKEVKSKVIEKSGLTFDGKETVCPGNNFTKQYLEDVIRQLNPDALGSKNKTLLLR